MKHKFKTALIGCGRIGFLLEEDPLRYKPCTHYGGAKAAGITINCAGDPDKERLMNFGKAAKIPAERLYPDYRKLLLNEQPDLVIIATWTEHHAEIGILAAQSGARTIICEKPLASNLKDADVFLNICKKNKVNLIVNHERRYDARYRKVKELIDAGKIGHVKTVHASILTSARQRKARLAEGGGPLLHDGTHMLDMIRFLFGDIKSVSGEIENNKGAFETRAVSWLKTASGIDVILEAGGSRNYFVFELEISGTDGKIIIGNGYEKLYIAKKSKFYTGFMDLEEVGFPAYKKTNYFKTEYIEAKESLIKSTNIASTGLDGYKALEAVHAVYLSSFLKGKEISLPLKPEKINLKKIFGI